ncbi:MAG: phosphopyruvate hydratase [Candidatus Nomurabacteria bacterium]|jgi:enolase|nr:phosphopyruvate hydratase [Candidatus Nomurabacteria bacterium]
MLIKKIKARQILDSRGNPTVECDVILEGGAWGRAAVPSGASTGTGEALELRDGGAYYGGKSVFGAVKNITQEIAPKLVGLDAAAQSEIDDTMIKLDDSDNKSRLGANAILAVSLATAKAEANAEGLPFYKYIAKVSVTTELSLPLPMMNLMNGGEHAGWVTDFQEYLIIPVGARGFAEAVRMGSEVFHALGAILKEQGYSTAVGDEGGFAPALAAGNEAPMKLIEQAVEKAGYKLGADIMLGLDAAASEFFQNGYYLLNADHAKLASKQMVEFWDAATRKYPIISIEDGLSESDWKNWTKLTKKIGKKIQIMGDDLLVTNTSLLDRAIREKAANAILIKPNQIGTLSETIRAVKLAQASGFRTVMSHRSGETEDVTIAHLAVGLNCGQIKTGSLSRSERVAKYNELMRIEEANPSLQLARPFD